MNYRIDIKKHWRITTALCAVTMLAVATASYGAGINTKGDAAASLKTESPIKHVIILIGENRGFDHTFGVYRPKGKGQTISNLLSKGIVNADGSPGPNYAKAQQYSVAPQPTYYVGAPNAAKFPYDAVNMMPQPNTNGAPKAPRTSGGPLTDLNQVLATAEHDIDESKKKLLTTGATNLPGNTLDTRVPGAGTLSGPYPLQGPALSDDDYTGDMPHLYWSMRQQYDCSVVNATPENPSGCLADLLPFVNETFDGVNFAKGNSMGFYNMEQGQAPLHKLLADRFTVSDNFHQSFMGGTGPNHYMLGTGVAGLFTDGKGKAVTPASNRISNANPLPGTVNQYTRDTSYVDCANLTRGGVAPIANYLNSLPYHPSSNCLPGQFYMINNNDPAFLANGFRGDVGSFLPPSSDKTIGHALMEKNISWAYYGGGYDDAVVLADAAVAAVAGTTKKPSVSQAALADPAHSLGLKYCDFCNWFQYSESIMADPEVRKEHIKDTADLIESIQNNTLPAVSFGKPDSLIDGHPQTSKIDLFEGYVMKLLSTLDQNPKLKATTAVIVTYDEGGGYYDSGFIQPIDFFGDGPRVPLLILSPYSTGGKVHHGYGDHVSLLKFIERNWGLQPLTNRSRDNYPNPISTSDIPYVPTNMPAITDLFDAFDFTHAVNKSYLGDDETDDGSVASPR
jgi:phospholipase C